MSHSIFTGRPWSPGEPLFLAEDTDAAVALAEEERDTCPSCGLLKVFCRNPDHQFAFAVTEEQCHASYALAAHRTAVNKDRDAAAVASIRMAPQFLPGFAPDLLAGLDLGDADQ